MRRGKIKRLTFCKNGPKMTLLPKEGWYSLKSLSFGIFEQTQCQMITFTNIWKCAIVQNAWNSWTAEQWHSLQENVPACFPIALPGGGYTVIAVAHHSIWSEQRGLIGMSARVSDPVLRAAQRSVPVNPLHEAHSSLGGLCQSWLARKHPDSTSGAPKRASE